MLEAEWNQLLIKNIWPTVDSLTATSDHIDSKLLNSLIDLSALAAGGEFSLLEKMFA